MKMIGLLLIVLGLVGLFYGGITYTKHEKVLDVGPIEAHVDREKRIPLPPIAGGLALVAGAILIVADRRSRAA